MFFEALHWFRSSLCLNAFDRVSLFVMVVLKSFWVLTGYGRGLDLQPSVNGHQNKKGLDGFNGIFVAQGSKELFFPVKKASLSQGTPPVSREKNECFFQNEQRMCFNGSILRFAVWRTQK